METATRHEQDMFSCGDMIVLSYNYVIYELTLMCSCNLNNSSLSYSTCCCSRSSDDWKYQVTPNSRTKLTTDSTKLTTNPTSLLLVAITARSQLYVHKLTCLLRYKTYGSLVGSNVIIWHLYNAVTIIRHEAPHENIYEYYTRYI